MIQTCKVFISMPMAGLTHEDIFQRQEKYFAIAKNYLKQKYAEFVLLQNVFSSEEDAAKSPLACFAKSIEVMAEADIVVLAGDWENARGCRLERAIAYAYGIKIMTINDDYDAFCDEGLILQ